MVTCEECNNYNWKCDAGLYSWTVWKLKSPASLWCEYSMLKTTILYKEDMDISKYAKLIGYLKRKNQGYVPKISKKPQ